MGRRVCFMAGLPSSLGVGAGPWYTSFSFFFGHPMGKQIIVIPAYNEEATVAQVVREAIQVADRVVVVDDGSRDRTSALAGEAGAVVVRHAVNRGLGGALGTGLAAAVKLDADAVVTMDADGQHQASD